MRKHLVILGSLVALVSVWTAQHEIQTGRARRHTVLARMHAPARPAARAQTAFEEFDQVLR